MIKNFRIRNLRSIEDSKSLNLANLNVYSDSIRLTFVSALKLMHRISRQRR